jgi:hypothetical protein
VGEQLPVEPGGPIGCHLGLDGRAQALQLGRVLGRHDEPEMMPVVPAVLGKNLLVDDVRSRVEHPCVGTIVGHPAALQIGDVPR